MPTAKNRKASKPTENEKPVVVKQKAKKGKKTEVILVEEDDK